MRLFAYYRSSTSYRVRIALNLKQLDYEIVPVNLTTAEQRDAAYRATNPFGSVPKLEADGQVRAQSMAILEWLDERWPEPPLLSHEPEARFRTRELAYALATELHAPLNMPVLNYLRDEFAQGDDGVRRWYHHWLARTLDPVEVLLDQAGSDDFPFGTPGLFEAVLVPQLYNARRFGFDLSPYPRMTHTEAACLALPAFVAAHPDQQPDAPGGENRS